VVLAVKKEEEEVEEQIQKQKLAVTEQDDLQERQGAGGLGVGEEEVLLVQSSQSSSDVWTLYLYEMKSPMTRQKYQRRFIKFLDFLGKVGNNDHNDDDLTLPQKSNALAQKAREDTTWAFECILNFIQYQIDRANKKEITGATVGNYVTSI
jgi:hypothetical protein